MSQLPLYTWSISDVTVVKKVGVPPLCCLEYIVKFLLQNRSFSQRPVRIFLMTENDILENGFRDAQKFRYFRVQHGAFCRDDPTLHMQRSGVRSRCLYIQTTYFSRRVVPLFISEDAFQCFHGHTTRLLHRYRQVTSGEHASAICSIKA